METSYLEITRAFLPNLTRDVYLSENIVSDREILFCFVNNLTVIYLPEFTLTAILPFSSFLERIECSLFPLFFEGMEWLFSEMVASDLSSNLTFSR